MATFVSRLDDITYGYVQASLNYLMALGTVKEPLSVMPLSQMVNWQQMPKWTSPLAYWTGQVGVPRDVGFLHQTPDALPMMPRLSEKSIGITTLETSAVPTWIISALNDAKFIESLVVPSEFNKKTFSESGYEKPIYVVPHTIGDWWWKAPTPPQIEDDRPFTFYYVGGWNNRKNPETILRAYLKAFPTPQDNVALALKITGGANIQSYIAQILKEEIGQPSRDDIWVWVEKWGEDQVRWLHHYGDVFVSTHRGEGFALGPLMAKLVGNSVIATNWSAPIEYLAENKGDILLPYQLVEVNGMDQQHHHFRVTKDQELLWAEPDIEACAKAMLEKASAGRQNKSFDGLDTMRNRYGWEFVGNELKNILDKYR